MYELLKSVKLFYEKKMKWEAANDVFITVSLSYLPLPPYDG